MDKFLSQLFGTEENMQKLASLGGTGEQTLSPQEEQLLKIASDQIDAAQQELAAEGKQVDLNSLSEEEQNALMAAALEDAQAIQASGAGGGAPQGESATEEQVVEAFNKLAFAETFGRTYGDMMVEAELQKVAETQADPEIAQLVALSKQAGAVGRTATMLLKAAGPVDASEMMNRVREQIAGDTRFPEGRANAAEKELTQAKSVMKGIPHWIGKQWQSGALGKAKVIAPAAAAVTVPALAAALIAHHSGKRSGERAQA